MSINKESLKKIIFDFISDYPEFDGDDINILELAIRDLTYFGEDAEQSFKRLLEENFDNLRKVNASQFLGEKESYARDKFGLERYNYLRGVGWYFSCMQIPKFLLQSKYGSEYAKYSYNFLRVQKNTK